MEPSCRIALFDVNYVYNNYFIFISNERKKLVLSNYHHDRITVLPNLMDPFSISHLLPLIDILNNTKKFLTDYAY